LAQDIKIEIGIVLFRACDMPLKVVLLSFSLARDFDYKSVIELTRSKGTQACRPAQSVEMVHVLLEYDGQGRIACSTLHHGWSQLQHRV
jgi:hypothetical protein